MTNRKNFTVDELNVILEKHILWLSDNTKGERANLIGANLIGANLRRANLRRANLRGANLRGANLRRANLSGADLRGANIWKADLSGADLSGADLRRTNLSGADIWRANLSEANLRGADLRGANIWKADLSGADLSGADLRRTNFSEADLSRTNLSGTNLSRADLSGAEYLPPICCPDTGSFIGYKKALGAIVKLEICEDALRSSATTRKCRCSKAKVLSITNVDGSDYHKNTVCSKHDPSFVYTVGEIVEVDDFDPDRWHECAPGIHFFITRDEAVNY